MLEHATHLGGSVLEQSHQAVVSWLEGVLGHQATHVVIDGVKSMILGGEVRVRKVLTPHSPSRHTDVGLLLVLATLNWCRHYMYQIIQIHCSNVIRGSEAVVWMYMVQHVYGNGELFLLSGYRKWNHLCQSVYNYYSLLWEPRLPAGCKVGHL